MAVEIDWDYCYTWRIENYSQSSYTINEKITSPEFEVKSLSDRTWCLGLYPEGNALADKRFVLCFLYQIVKNDSNKDSIIDYEISLLNANSDILISKSDENRIFKKTDSWGSKKLIKVDQLKDEIKKCSEDTLIVQCRIKNKDNSNKLKAEKYCLKWPVQVLPNGIFTSAKHFFCLDNLLLQMVLFLNNGSFHIKICNMTKNVLPSHPITCRISVLDAKGNEAFLKTESHVFDLTRESESWEFPSLMTTRMLQDKMNEYIMDGNIVFRCEFSLNCGEIVAATVSNRNNETVSNIEGLVNLNGDLQSLFSKHSPSDLKLRVNGEVELNAHKCILATRSAVFSAMFNGEMVENLTGIVDIEDMDSNTLKSFLEFLYTGTLDDMNYEKATKLLMAADKYQVSSLKEMCAYYLVSAISTEKVCEVLALADMVRHKHLKIRCFDFISKFAKDVFTSMEWIELIKNNGALVADVIAYIGKNCTITPHHL